jgi:hypothetical protein
MVKQKVTKSWQESISKEQPKSNPRKKGGKLKWLVLTLVCLLLIVYLAYVAYISEPPDQFNVIDKAIESAGVETLGQLTNGYIFGNTLAMIGQTLLHKKGGYLSNDVFPGPLIDNMPSWEYGAIVMLRDGTSALRNHFGRSQSQSRENADLSRAEPYFYNLHDSYMFPATEVEYGEGIKHLQNYLRDLNLRGRNAEFFARADNLDNYLQAVLKRLGDYSFRLTASSIQTERYVENVDGRNVVVTKTPWTDVDDVFWEARGATWALLHIFRAIEADFSATLKSKAADATMTQIIQELEDSQAETLSPVILNGDGFGLFANYSLTLANHIARATAATIDLRELMLRG